MLSVVVPWMLFYFLHSPLLPPQVNTPSLSSHIFLSLFYCCFSFYLSLPFPHFLHVSCLFIFSLILPVLFLSLFLGVKLCIFTYALVSRKGQGEFKVNSWTRCGLRDKGLLAKPSLLQLISLFDEMHTYRLGGISSRSCIMFLGGGIF